MPCGLEGSAWLSVDPTVASPTRPGTRVLNSTPGLRPLERVQVPAFGIFRDGREEMPRQTTKKERQGSNKEEIRANLNPTTASDFLREGSVFSPVGRDLRR